MVLLGSLSMEPTRKNVSNGNWSAGEGYLLLKMKKGKSGKEGRKKLALEFRIWQVAV